MLHGDDCTTLATHPTHPCRIWPAWLVRAGQSSSASRRAKARRDWTTTRSAAGTAGIATSPSYCWVLLAHTFLADLRRRGLGGAQPRGLNLDAPLVPLSVPEARGRRRSRPP